MQFFFALLVIRQYAKLLIKFILALQVSIVEWYNWRFFILEEVICVCSTRVLKFCQIGLGLMITRVFEGFSIFKWYTCTIVMIKKIRLAWRWFKVVEVRWWERARICVWFFHNIDRWICHVRVVQLIRDLS